MEHSGRSFSGGMRLASDAPWRTRQARAVRTIRLLEIPLAIWTIEKALPVVQTIAVIGKEHGFSVALYGSVLVAGESNKDPDLFFIASETRLCADHARACLSAIAEKFGIGCPRLTTMCTSRIELGDGKRIDGQFLSGQSLA